MRSVILGLAISLAAIGVAQAADGPVVVRDSAAVAGCTMLGEVQAKSNIGGAMAQMGYDRALKQFKDRALALGATHVQIVDSSSGMTGTRLLGNAYRCAQPAS